MSTQDIEPVVAYMAAQISALPDIGLVFEHDPWDRKDIANVLVSVIDGRKTLRAWWVSGPTLNPTAAGEEGQGESLGNAVTRTWTYSINGVEGLAPAWQGDGRGPGGDLITLRNNALAVTDLLDADLRLGGTCALSNPCLWAEPPVHRTFAGLVAVSYVQILKQVITV